MPKEQKSKLDQYVPTLLIMGDERKTLDEMLAWLKEEGVCVAKSTLSEFLEKQRQLRAQSQLLFSIASGAEQCKTVEAEFSKNPAPEFETIVKLHRVIILHLTTMGRQAAGGDLELIKLADQMTHTVLSAISAKTKAELEKQKLSIQERRVKLLEQKAAAFDQARQVAGSDLSEEEKKSRMREIFGL